MMDIFELIRQKCPNGVPCVAIKDLGKFEHGVGLDKSMLRSEGPIPVIHYGEIYTTYNLKTDKTVSFLGAGTAVSVSAHHGDVVVCLTETANLGFVGKAVAQICGVDVAVSGDAGVLHLNPDEADAVFVSHIMDTERFQIQKEKCKRGTTVMHLAISLWQKIKISLPPLQIQREIVAILDKFDTYCNSITAGLAGELEMRRKQYRYWRDKIFQDLLDEGCGIRKLKDVASIINGRDYKHLGEGDVPVYGSGGVMCSVSEVMYDGPSVLIPRKGSLGNLFYSEGPIWCVDTIFHTVIDDSIVNPKFLYYVIRWRNVEQLGSGGGVPGLTQRMLYKLDIPVPDMARQREIVGILDKFRELELRRKQYGYYRDMLLSFPEQKGV